MNSWIEEHMLSLKEKCIFTYIRSFIIKSRRNVFYPGNERIIKYSPKKLLVIIIQTPHDQDLQRCLAGMGETVRVRASTDQSEQRISGGLRSSHVFTRCRRQPTSARLCLRNYSTLESHVCLVQNHTCVIQLSLMYTVQIKAS